MADGTITLSTNLDTSGVSKGITAMRKKFAEWANERANPGTLTTAIKDQEVAIANLKKELALLVSQGKGSSAEAKTLEKDIASLTAEMNQMTAAADTLNQKNKKSFAGLGVSLNTLASRIAVAFGVRQLISFSNEAATMASQTEASVQRLSNIYGEASNTVGDFIDENARALGMAKSSAASYASVYGNLFSSWADSTTNANLTNQYLQATAVIASNSGRTIEDVQERIRSGLLGNTEAIEDLGIFVNVSTIEMTEAFKRMSNGESWQQLDEYTKQQIRSMAILEQATDKYGNEVLETTNLIRSSYQAAYEDFKNTWGEVVNTVLIPIMNILAQVFTMATTGLNALMGKSGKLLGTAAQIEGVSSGTANNIQKQANNQESVNKATKKTLAGFDELEILSSDTAESTAEESGAGATGALGITPAAGGETDTSKTDEVSEALLALMGVVSLCLVAVGVILLFTGNIAYGIGFIIAGAALFAVTAAAAEEYDYNGVISMLTTIMGVAAGALIALGIILLWLGGVVGKGVAIGMIVAGGVLLVSAVATQAAFAPDDIAGWLGLILGIAAGALLALGVILCMVGSIPMGVGMIIAGAVSLVAAVVINSDAIVEAVQGPLGKIVAIAGAALLVLGIILCCTGVALPLGIALIAAGAVSLATTVALNWDAIVDKVKEIWNKVKAFWDKYIAVVFTKEFWLALAKNCGNGLIGGFEAAINGIIGLWEKFVNFLVDALNEISFDVPDWVPLIGGKKFGFDIPKVSFERVSLPRLAKGMVIPGGREFAAILGDQPRGQTNIEAPLSTIEEAVENVLARRSAETVREEHYYLDRTELMNIIYKLAKGGERINGTSLVKQGGY